MKRTLFMLFAFMAAITAFCQNLAEGKTSIATSGNAALGNDGQTDSRWESEQGVDPQTWQVDLGEAQEFNQINIIWEGAYAKTFTIEAGNTVDEDGFLTGGTTIVEVSGQTLSEFPYTQKLSLDTPVNARYIKFNGTERGTPYGYSFWEFQVFNIGVQTLASLSLSPANPDKADPTLSACKVGASIKLTPKALDTDNVDYPLDGISYAVTNGTIDASGNFTPSAKGVCTITATLEDKTATATIYAYEGDNLLLNKTGITNPEASNANLFFDGDWGNRGGLGQPTDNHTWVYVDLQAYYTIDLVDLKQEQACGKNYSIQFSSDGSTWTDAYTITDEAGMQGDVRHYFFGATNNTNVRMVRFDCTAPATGYGVSIYEMAAYGEKTGDLEDSEAPVLSTAEASVTTPVSITLKLKATDETVSSITYTITDTNNNQEYTTVGESGVETEYDITGLTAGTAYSFSIVASDGQNVSEAMIVNVSTKTWEDVPVPTATNTIPIYGSALGNASNYGFYDWGGGTGTATTINGKNAYGISNFKWFGSQFNEIDASDMTTLHLDVYPFKTTTLTIVPINAAVEGSGNQPEKGYQFNVTGGEWNALEIPVADVIADGVTMTKFYQIKYVSKVFKNGVGATDGFENGDGSLTFYVGNVYLYGEEVVDTENPVLVTAEATEIGGNSVTLKLNATDNNDKVTFLINDAANNKSYETTGTSGNDVIYQITQLNANTSYSFTVQAKDIAGNLSETMTVEFTTSEGFSLTAAPTPDKNAEDVLSIYSDAYTAATAFNFGGWGQSTAVATETINGDNMLKLTNYNYLGFEYLTDLDLSDMEYLHIDILPMQAMNFGITPIMRGGKTEDSQNVGTLNVEQWNSIDIPLSQFGFDLSYKTFQLKLDKGTGSEIVYVDNIYFWKSGSTGPEPETPTSGEGEYLIETGMNAGKVLKYTYEFVQTGMDVTVTFANVSTDEIIGIVDGYIFDYTDGFAEHAGLTYTWTNCTVGQTIKAAHKWMFAEGDFVTDQFTYTVKEATVAEITAISLSASDETVEAGKTVQLTVKDQDDNALAADKVTFSSSNDEIATVDATGLVTGVAEGTAVITATLNDNNEVTAEITITVTAPASNALTDLGADENGMHKLTGVWDADAFAAIDAAAQANSYDLTEVEHEGTIDVIGKTANPYCIFVTAVAGTVNRNEAVKDGDAYNGFAFFLQEEPNANKPFDINTAITPISVTNPFFQRLFDRAGYYVTMTVPFSYTQIPDGNNGTKFYELNASSNSDGVTLTFTEASSVEANKPYLVYSGTGGITIPDAGVVTIDWDAQAETSEVASFVGNYKALQPAESENIYVVPGGVTEQENVSFLKSAGATIRPFRAYLTLTNATKINVVFGDGEATGIRGVSDDMLNALFNIYSIDGKLVKSAGEKMFNLKEGIYIINGKRVIIR